MTPLPRWVLLALLLAVVSAQPLVDDACVQLQRTWDTSPENTRFCEHQQDLQSRIGQLSIQDYISYCLTPCHAADSTDSLVFDGSEICLGFRDGVLRRLGCFCDSPGDDGTRNLREDRLMFLRLLKNDGFKMLRKVDKNPALVDVQNQQESNLFKSIMKIADSEDVTVSNLNTFEEGSYTTEEGSIDWNMWCKAQCDSGKGGSACYCDIIP